MGLQLTTLMHRLGGAWGVVAAGPAAAGARARSEDGLEDDAVVAAGSPGDVRDRTAEHVRRLLPDDARDRFDALVDGAPDAVVLRRTLAATTSVDAVEEVRHAWSELSAAERRAVRDPVRAMARAGRQSDGTTCGSSVLVMLAAHGDPTLAVWLATGRTTASARPSELAGAGPAALRSLADAPREARFAVVQRVLKRRTSERAVLGLPWPPRYGTPPWTAARTARFLGVPYGHRPLDDTDAPHLARALDAVGRTVDVGVPVPLYTGGDTDRGWGTAVPRHVVLAFARDAAGLHVWEPGAGAVVVAPPDVLTAGRPHAALGGWDHLVWLVAPRGSSRAGLGAV